MESQDDPKAQNGEPSIREELPIQHPASTTIGTIVVQGGPLQLVIAVLQCGDVLHIKVADIIPKLTFLGDNLNEALILQRQHEDLIRQIQEMPSPIAEFYHKVQEKIAANTRIDPNLVLDMAKNLEYIWQDIIRILQQRRVIINYNTNFFEKLGECYGKMSALEVACNDTMIPMETEAVKDFIEKFKLLRTEMLTSVMATLTIGNQLLDQLRDIASQGTLDSRPDFIKQDAINSVRKVEQWLEDLHDKRNNLELAWQTRKTQLEQCMELTVINKDLAEVEAALNQRKQTLGAFNLGNSSREAASFLDEIRGLRQDVVALRDRALKLTKATENLVSQNFFAGEEACTRAYGVLSYCTTFYDEIDRRETLLEQSKVFFERAELALERLAKQEAEIENLPLRPGSPNVIPTHIRMLDEVKELVIDALTAGYQILDETGRNQPEVFGIERTIEAIENRNAHLDNLCQLNSEKYIKISETLNSFLERYNELFSWLEQQKTDKIIGGPINNMGTNLQEARDCLNAHTRFLGDLEEKGNEINSLLGNLKTIVEFLDDNQRHEVDRKIDALRKNWSELKNFVLARVDVIDSYIHFHEKTEQLREAFRNLESNVNNFQGIDTSAIEEEWGKIRNQYANLKDAAQGFNNHVAKVADPYLQTEAAVSCVEKILSEFSNRQLELTTEWENVTIKNEIEVLLKDIIMANEETLSATSKIEAQLYPIFTTDKILPLELIAFLDERIRSVETDIQFADDELVLRIQKLAKLESRDRETAAKIDQVRSNLDEIKQKLHTIRLDYRHLVKDSRTFLESVEGVRENIRKYFAEKPAVEDIGVDVYSQEYEKFKYKTMEEVHGLLQKSEELIAKLKQQEPQGAKEHDSDRVITVLEQLRSFFDQQADQENAKVRKLQVLDEFKRGAADIDESIDQLNGQLDKLDGKYGDSSASAKAISISFEYFERNIELLGKSLENLKNTSKNIIGTYPDLEGFVVSRANEIKHKWDELKDKAKKARKLVDLSIEYFNLIDQIETNYRRHSTYLVNMSALADQVNTPESGEHLARELEKYVTEHEQPQLSDLKKLAQMSQNLYDEDRTVPIHTDNINLFQSFHKLKADIDERVDKLKEIEAQHMEEERRVLQEKMRQAELEREYANLVDAVDAAYRRHNTYLGNTAAMADQINSPESGEHLSQEVAKYINENQAPQMNDIKKLAEMSLKIYGEDRTPKIQLDNMTLFQALNNLKEDIDDKVRNLQAIEVQRMEEEKKALEEKLRQAELEREYQNLLDQIEAAYRRHTAYFSNTGTLIGQVNTPESGEHLAKEIDKYLNENEQPQFNDLNRLSQMSLRTFGDDKSIPVYNDNVTLFQSLHHLRSEVGAKVETLRELEAQKAEKERSELEEKMKRAELERAYQDLLDQIDAACRRHNAYFSNASTLTENVNTPEAGEHLARELENYLRTYEQPQLDKLKTLAQMSREIYGEDLTEGIYLDNVGIFQALRKLLSDVCERIEFLKDEEAKQMDESRRALEERMKAAELEREFANLINTIEGARQRHQSYLNNVKSLISQINTPESGEHLSRELQKYIDQNEQPQIDNLKRLVEIAQRVFDDDRAGEVHTNNIELFQEFHKVKVEIDLRVKELRDVDDLRMEEERRKLEARMKEAEAERAQIEEQRRREEEQRLALEEDRKKKQAELALLEEQRRREESERLSHEEQKLKEQAQHALLEQQRLKELAERDRYEEERKRKETEHAALEEQKRKEEAARFASYEPPIFIKPLSDATVLEGERFVFECFIKGHPEPTIQWFKDGVTIPKDSDYKASYDNGMCRLTIEETFTADTAVFTCKASNSVGVSASAAKLFVRESSPEEVMTPPMFVKPLESGTANEGGSFQFRAVVTGNPLPEVSWYKNDICVDNSPDYIIRYNNGEAVLKFEEVFLEDQALFKCRAKNSSGFEDSIAQLTVEPLEPTELPSFRVPLSNVMARVGQKIKLDCEIVGIPEPEVFWLHNDKLINRDVKLHYESERATLVINEAFLKDAGVYTITAKNIAGEVSSSCNVIVKGKLPNETSDSEAQSDMEPIKPSVQLPLKNVAVFEGKPVRLDCVIIGIPEPEVIWYHNERPVKESPDVQLLFQGDRCSLVINEAFLEDAGDYKVFAINNAGEASSQCTLSVTPLNLAEPAVRPAPVEKVLGKSPSFQKLLTDVLCNEGDFVELDCIIQGEPVPEIKWYLNNREIGESSRVNYVHQSDGTVKLKIEDVRVEDKGVYTVKAVNEAGESKCFAHLNVKPIVNAVETQTDTIQPEPLLVEPSFKELFADLTVPESGTAKFECIVIGKPTPKVRWLFNDMPVAGREFLISTSGERQVLTIPETTKATTGKITCVAENELGRAICIAYLNVGTPVPTIIDNSTHTSSHTSSVHKEYITTNTTKVIENGNTTQDETHTKQLSHDQTVRQLNDAEPQVMEARQFNETREAAIPPPQQQQPAIKEAKDVQDSIIASSGQISTGKPARKNLPPRFVTPFVGKIVDQFADVVFEAMIDGFPTPTIEVTKNGNPLDAELEHVNVMKEKNKVTVTLKNVSINDAGRYSCNAANAAGSAGCTADLIVKKSIFPPVFCPRLSSTIINAGDRLNLECTITGSPEPTVTWYKDDKPLKEAGLSQHILQAYLPNSYKLTIEHAQFSDAGKFMVKATNAGGEARSIADVVVLEKQPQPIVHLPQVQMQQNQQQAAEVGSTTQLTQTTQTSVKQFVTSSTMACGPDGVSFGTNTDVTPYLTGATQTQITHGQPMATQTAAEPIVTQTETEISVQTELQPGETISTQTTQHSTQMSTQTSSSASSMATQTQEFLKIQRQTLQPDTPVLQQQDYFILPPLNVGALSATKPEEKRTETQEPPKLQQLSLGAAQAVSQAAVTLPPQIVAPQVQETHLPSENAAVVQQLPQTQSAEISEGFTAETITTQLIPDTKQSLTTETRALQAGKLLDVATSECHEPLKADSAVLSDVKQSEQVPESETVPVVPEPVTPALETAPEAIEIASESVPETLKLISEQAPDPIQAEFVPDTTEITSEPVPAPIGLEPENIPETVLELSVQEMSTQVESETGETVSTQTASATAAMSTQTLHEIQTNNVQTPESQRQTIQAAQPTLVPGHEFSMQTEPETGETISTQTISETSTMSTQTLQEILQNGTQTSSGEIHETQVPESSEQAETEIHTKHEPSEASTEESDSIVNEFNPQELDAVLQPPARVYQMEGQESERYDTPLDYPLHVDIERAVEYGYSPKPIVPTTPTKGARLQSKIKAIEEAQREKADVAVMGGIKVFPQMSVEEKRPESLEMRQTTEIEKKEVRTELVIEPYHKLEHKPEFVPPQYSNLNDGPKPYEGVPYMPEVRPIEINLEKTFTETKLPEIQPIENSVQQAEPRYEVETPASGYQVSMTESEIEEHRLSTLEKRRLFEQKIQEVSSTAPIERQGFVQLYNPEEVPEEQQQIYRTLQAKRELFEQKIQEIQESTLPPLPHRADLTSPNVILQQRPLSAADVGLEPGTPPELLFAPKFEGKGQTPVREQQVHQTETHQETRHETRQETRQEIQQPRPVESKPVQPISQNYSHTETRQEFSQYSQPPAQQYRQEYHVQPVYNETHEVRETQTSIEPTEQYRQQPVQQIRKAFEMPPASDYRHDYRSQSSHNEIRKEYHEHRQETTQRKSVEVQRPQPALPAQQPAYQQNHSEYREEYNGPTYTESHQEYSSFSSGFRRVEPPKSSVQPHLIIKPQPVAPSHFERPAEPEPTFKPIPQVPAPVPPKPAPKPQQKPFAGHNSEHETMRRSYSEQQHQHMSTHQKLVQHHHQESKSYHHQHEQEFSAQQQQVPVRPAKPQPKLVKPIPINAATAAPVRQSQAHQPTQKQFQPLEPLPFKPEPARPKPAKVPPPPSPSKFVKGQFRDSEYESDVDSRIPAKWHPHNQAERDLHYKPVRPVLTPTGHGGRSTLGRSPTPPTEFDRPPTIEGPPRPKFQPIERQREITVPHTQVVRPKPIQAKPVYTQSRSHDERTHREVYNSGPTTKTYYTAIAGQPVHNAIATETSKTMHMKESTEKTQRTVNVTHTHRIIALDDNRQQNGGQQPLEPFPYTPPPVSMRTRQRVPPPPTPTKFIPGEFRESDYDSEVESARIRALWTPNPDNQEPYFRSVRAPQGGRSTSVPRGYERVMTPMEFDQGPIMPSKIDVLSDREYYNKTQTLDRSMMRKEKNVKSTTRDDIDIRNKYTSYKSVAKQEMDSMSSQFKDKAHQFIQDIRTDQQQAPVVKRATSVQGDRKPQFYRDENRVSEYGTKHIDPDTGLIYFKYDFGYEFGIIFPGEGRKIVGGYRNQGGPRNEISNKPSPRQAGDIEMPVLHERTPAGGNRASTADEIAKKRYSLPAHFNGGDISPASAGYVTPIHGGGASSDAWNSYGRTTPSTPGAVLGNVVNQEAPQAPRKPPMWITPLRDIAAVSGQLARFECIVQCEPHPDVIWAKNGELLQNTTRLTIEFRNGVCRLTIPEAYPIDAGQYSCTATNVHGSVTTTAQLIVPTGKKGVRK